MLPGTNGPGEGDNSLYSRDVPPYTYLCIGQSKSTRVRMEVREGGSCAKKGGFEEHGPGNGRKSEVPGKLAIKVGGDLRWQMTQIFSY